jgi:hypothetical protein
MLRMVSANGIVLQIMQLLWHGNVTSAFVAFLSGSWLTCRLNQGTVESRGSEGI